MTDKTREHAFTTLGGVPVNYDRAPVAAYGTVGVGRTFHCTHAFYAKLDACFTELWRVCPEGRPMAVASAGAQVAKSGQHGLGRAFDLDGIFWPGKSFVTKKFPEDPAYYLGVEAILRKHFGIVLDYNYNSAHRDHFHIDDGSTVGYKTTRSHTVFVQAACFHVMDIEVKGGIDGVSGKNTRTALDAACAKLGVSTPLTTPANWLAFLDGIATTGMTKIMCGG